MTDWKKRAKDLIAIELGVDIAEVTEKAFFKHDLGADSLDTIEIVLAFEKEFKIQISEEEIVMVSQNFGLGSTDVAVKDFLELVETKVLATV